MTNRDYILLVIGVIVLIDFIYSIVRLVKLKRRLKYVQHFIQHRVSVGTKIKLVAEVLLILGYIAYLIIRQKSF